MTDKTPAMPELLREIVAYCREAGHDWSSLDEAEHMLAALQFAQPPELAGVSAEAEALLRQMCDQSCMACDCGVSRDVWEKAQALALRPAQPAAAVSDGWTIDDIGDGSINVKTPDGYACRLFKSGGGGVESLAYRLAILALRPQAVPMTGAARDVLAERQRQISAEGWTPEHDDEHDVDDLAQAAAVYALPPHLRLVGGGPFRGKLPTFWRWAPEWWKPADRRRELLKAGALILAEIERLDRASGITAPGAEGGDK